MDTKRITVWATGALDLDSEELNFIFAPRPKRASLINSGYLIFVWARTGWGETNPCVATVEEARKLKGRPERPVAVKDESPENYAPLAGCSPLMRRCK